MKVTLKISKPDNKTKKVKGGDLDTVFENLNGFPKGQWATYVGNHQIKVNEKKGEVNLTAKPVITMPSWSGYTKASKAEKTSWDDMWQELKAHEDGHHDILVKHLGDFAASLKDTEELDRKAVDKAYTAFEKSMFDAQKKYDGTYGCSAELVIPLPEEIAEG